MCIYFVKKYVAINMAEKLATLAIFQKFPFARAHCRPRQLCKERRSLFCNPPYVMSRNNCCALYIISKLGLKIVAEEK